MACPVLFGNRYMPQLIGSVVTRSKPQPFGSLLVGGRRTWLVVAAMAMLGGVALNWSWLVAVGIAPLLLAIAPCAAMCALGMCMKPAGEGCKQHGGAGSATPAPVQVKAREPGPA